MKGLCLSHSLVPWRRVCSSNAFIPYGNVLICPGCNAAYSALCDYEGYTNRTSSFTLKNWAEYNQFQSIFIRFSRISMLNSFYVLSAYIWFWLREHATDYSRETDFFLLFLLLYTIIFSLVIRGISFTARMYPSIYYSLLLLECIHQLQFETDFYFRSNSQVLRITDQYKFDFLRNSPRGACLLWQKELTNCKPLPIQRNVRRRNEDKEKFGNHNICNAIFKRTPSTTLWPIIWLGRWGRWVCVL